MKAIVQDRYGDTDVLQFRDIDPPVCGDHEVVVRVRAAGVDPSVWHLMAGVPYLIRLGFGVRAPRQRVRGSDVAGTVDAVGKNVTRFRPGDEVFGLADGSFAEYATARERKLAHKPRNLTFDQAAVVAMSGLTALQGLRDKGMARQGQHVLVIGAAGGVGSYAVQLAKAYSAHVTGVCSTAKVELVRELGADKVIDYTREDVGERSDRYDVILDTAGHRSVSQLRRCLTPRGTLVIVGSEVDGRWLGGTQRLLGAIVLSPFVSQRMPAFVSSERFEDLEVLRDFIESGAVAPVIDRTYALADAAAAVRYIHAGHAAGKVVLSV